MHILVTNDDGPPSRQASPYILPFVNALEKSGHDVSVIVPNVQRSWIGKAHIVGQDVQSTSYWPPQLTPEEHSADVSTRNESKQPWILVDSTPAACAQLGLSQFFNDRGPIDLVISGPNYGRNTTAVFALSSGTLGAALEASVCGYRAIAISFAFFDRKNDPAVIEQCCTHAVRIVNFLANKGRWGDGLLYSVNVPLKEGVADRRVLWTKMLQNQWTKGACYQETSGGDSVDDPNSEEAKLRQQETGEDGSGPGRQTKDPWRNRNFKWAPQFASVFDSVEKAGPGSDGWAIKAGETSVTPIYANYKHADGYDGEVDLSKM